MKGQSAIEYLMTYGWMLLVVAVVSGTVYSVAGNQCVESASGFSGQEVGINDFTVSGETDNLVVLIENNGPETVGVNEVVIQASGEDVVQQLDDFEISPGDSESVELSEGFATSDQCNTFDLGINYDSGGLTNVEVSGEITGGLEVVELPEAPVIDNVDQ